MDETNTSDADNVLPPNDVKPSSPNNETDAAASRLSPLIENLPNNNTAEESICTLAEPSEPKSDSNTDQLPIESETVQTAPEPAEPPVDPPDDRGEKPPESNEQEQMKNDDTDKCSDDENKNTENDTQNQSLIDDSEDLLVPLTDYVPDSADVIGDDLREKRKYTNNDEFNEKCKKFRHDPLAEDDVSMQTDEDNEDNEENEDNGTEMDNICAGDEDLAPAAGSPDKSTIDNNIEMSENCETVNDELNITDILTKGISSEKTIALADIFENADDLIKKEEEETQVESNDSLDKNEIEQKSSGDADELPVTNKEETPHTTTDDMNFDISEKLKDMGEISLAPVSKTDRKILPEFDLGDEISLEQICKKSGDGDDKRNKVSNLRKNIREVMDDNQLDASTLAAQREELERLARVQEQQRMIREMQRQVALDRQNSKTQNKVLSLLTGHTSLLKSSNASSSKLQVTSPTSNVDDILSGKSGNLTPSVSIAPIKSTQKKSEPMDISDTTKAIESPTKMDEDSNEKMDKSVDDLLIVEEEDELPTDDDDDEDDDDDDVVELKPKRDIVTIDDSSDDDCIM